MKILITGSKSQIGKELSQRALNFPDWDWKFMSKKELDITDESKVKQILEEFQPDFIINCAAYTAVDKAEDATEIAYKVNSEGPKWLSAHLGNGFLIHISTDFVFDGNSPIAYQEEDGTSPLGVYGHSKLKGEKEIQDKANRYAIIRTSWLYGEYGQNFLKTMLDLSKKTNTISVVTDQIGTPTFTGDLAQCLIDIVLKNGITNGTYHFSNEGVASWYDFAQSIFEYAGKNLELKPIKAYEYPTQAKRPHFSVLDKSKIKNELGFKIPHWRESLKKVVVDIS
ncbi:hypothetical protein P872_01530 [Rhodonellum psychrophilum GCM71 = DSM 17998]|uniref:dTDP-4-dehydrorhamnose reductase n=2 Tax=Rhodonellum TaxID=336827 RepID=U5C2E1_9BACT|nr:MULTISPECIES: dTDP-4-dehydrorhamnose reductase [Rhodonellum]ERM83969.1 hypothetical protein P872_01530 [Rhodonellum psychrophilum GCM71 = DSM 17998]SDZ05728.1 dTDP-4-dehydrorhamnose reductase [Rhodonellum ikkaensis]